MKDKTGEQLLAALAQLCQRGGELSWRELLETGLALFVQAVGASEGSVALLDEQGQPLVCLPTETTLSADLCAALRDSPWLEHLRRREFSPLPLPPSNTACWLWPCPWSDAIPAALMAFSAVTTPLPQDILEQATALAAPLFHNARLRRQLEQEEQRHSTQSHTSAAGRQEPAFPELPDMLAHLATAARQVLGAEHLAILYRDGDVRQQLLGYPAGLDFLQQAEGQQPSDQPLQLVDAWEASPALAEIAKREEFHTVLLLPLRMGEQTVGTAFLSRDRTQPFTAAEIALSKNLVQQTAWALKGLFSLQASQRREAGLEQLNAVITAVNSLSDLSVILRTGLASALEIAGMDQGGIYLWDTRENVLCLQTQHELIPESSTHSTICRSGQGLIGRAFNEQRNVMGRALPTGLPHPSSTGKDTAALQINIPLMVEGQAVGVLSMSAPRDDVWLPETARLLESLTKQLAVAVQRNRIAQQVQDQLQALHHLYEVSAGLLTEGSTPAVRFLLLRTLSDILPASVSTAFYTLKSGQWLRAGVYAPHTQPALGALWEKGPVGDDETQFLVACLQERILIRVDERRGHACSFWQPLAVAGVRQVLYFPLSLPDGEVFGVVGIALNEDFHLSPQESALVWTLLRQGTAALAKIRLYEASRDGESRLRAILESSEDGIFLVGENLKIHYVNGRSLELMGISDEPGNWEGRSFPQAIARVRLESRELARCLVQGARHIWSEGAPSTEDAPSTTFTTRQGQILTLQRWPVYSSRQQLLGGLFLLRDVTAQKALERMRDDLLQMLVHDMRNPLSTIINAVEIVQDPDMADIAEEATVIALNNAERALMLVNAILDISKLESGRFELHPEIFNLSTLLHSLDHYLAFATQTTLEVNADPDLPPVL
ncbi:MAG: GAF domain-containing protein, partial [Chloroflexota bacterium]|nr:GAF domain-containing protein [Chloroflexota bacterium]